MGADNWGICPKCKKGREKYIAGLRKKADEQYGKIKPEEYLELLDHAKEELGSTLREDYEILTDEDGEFYIKYSCNCSVCGFDYEFEHT